MANEAPFIPCICCGIGLEVEQAQCGHWFCYICRGRGHDEPDQCVECQEAKGRDRVFPG